MKRNQKTNREDEYDEEIDGLDGKGEDREDEGEVVVTWRREREER